MKLLEGKVAIITGASRGIGSGIAKVFAQHGANVAFTYSSSAESALALENELSAMGIKAKGYKSNAADFNEAQKLVDDVMVDFGNVDVLINNAGITKDNLLMRMSEEDFDKVIEINFLFFQRYFQFINYYTFAHLKRPLFIHLSWIFTRF
jgi:3-oxoacyl-[acyl-carrier protein] reductase